MSAELAAFLAAAGLVLLAAFQAALAAGAPLGRAAWGGAHERLPRNLRIGSLVAVLVWLGAALVILDRGGVPILDIPDDISRIITWLLVPVLVVGAVMNFASSSPWERFGWGPFALVVALLTLVVALS